LYPIGFWKIPNDFPFARHSSKKDDFAFMKNNPEINASLSQEIDGSVAVAHTFTNSIYADYPTNPEHKVMSTCREAIDIDMQASQKSEPSNSTSVFDVIKRRRSVGQVTQEQPTQAQIERLLEAATYGPSHHVTEPWHFFVLTGAARDKLGEIMEKSMRLRLHDAADEQAQKQIWKERMKPLRAPVIITVALRDAQHLAGELIENIEAAAAAVQNMLLAAEEMGLATIWRTGQAAYDPLIKQWLGLSPDDPIIAFVYVGYPRFTRLVRIPTLFTAKTTWLS
jgi:nitroreductase